MEKSIVVLTPSRTNSLHSCVNTAPFPPRNKTTPAITTTTTRAAAAASGTPAGGHLSCHSQRAIRQGERWAALKQQADKPPKRVCATVWLQACMLLSKALRDSTPGMSLRCCYTQHRAAAATAARCGLMPTWQPNCLMPAAPRYLPASKQVLSVSTGRWWPSRHTQSRRVTASLLHCCRQSHARCELTLAS